MEQRHSIEVLDLASARPVHRRTPSSKTSILKALISPVKSQRRAEPPTSANKNALDGRPALRARDSQHLPLSPTRVPTRSSDDRNGSFEESPSKRFKENIDPSEDKGTHTYRTGGRVRAAVAALQGKKSIPLADKELPQLDEKTMDEEFEAMLNARNVAPHMREKMRNLTLRVKMDLVKQELGSPVKGRPSQESVPMGDDNSSIEETRRSRSRPRSRTFTFSRGDKLGEGSSPKKRGRSKSRGDTEVLTAQRSPSKTRTPSRAAKARIETPESYISYLKAESNPVKVEVGRLHKLRILLRNETVGWVNDFIAAGGMSLIHGLLMRIMQIEWREEHEDQLLHETLLCLKGLCTTESALSELEKHEEELFPALLAMLFDPERKGPAEYSTRMVIMNVLFAYLACKVDSPAEILEARAQKILACLGQQNSSGDTQALDFVLDMQTPRPYQAWVKEITNVTREVFWIFLHSLNVIPLERPSSARSQAASEAGYVSRHFPGARPPVPAAPYIGGVEWDAAMYLAAHLDLVNGLVAALSHQSARNTLRQQLQLSGLEKTMGGTLRTCKEKFYGGIHDGLRAWVKAAHDDGWPTLFVREGPTLEEQAKSARSSPQKGKKQAAPQLDEVQCPVLDFKLPGLMKNDDINDGWLD